MKVSSGKRGDVVRADCFVEVINRPGSLNKIVLKSKVKALFGKSIEELVQKMLAFYEINGVEVLVEDSGALPFALAARIEKAFQKYSRSSKQFVFNLLPENQYTIPGNRYRRSRLYIPGNNPKMMINVGIYGSDAVILDLEDSVSPEKKEEARILVRNALCQIDFKGAERMVRINQLPAGLTDLEYIVPYNAHTVLIPKCELPEQVIQVGEKIQQISAGNDSVYLMPIIESALGVENAYQIATASPSIVALAIGLEDYTADLGVQRTTQAPESFYARSRIVNAACAAGIQPIDSVFSDFENGEKVLNAAHESKAMGFAGMGCIHPVQVEWVNRGFSPSEKEIEKAQKIVLAFEKAQKEGRAVVAIGSKMVDPPVVKRALKTVTDALVFGLIEKEWRSLYEN